MKIYPKTNEMLEGIENLEEAIKKYKGIEITINKIAHNNGICISIISSIPFILY